MYTYQGFIQDSEFEGGELKFCTTRWEHVHTLTRGVWGILTLILKHLKQFVGNTGSCGAEW